MPWLLIFIGLILITLNVLAIKKQNRSFNGLLGNAMGNINDEDIRIAELRREFSESILELQSEIMDMKMIMEKNNPDEIIIDKPNISSSNNEKIQNITKLFAQGYSEDSISKMLHLGKGEVLLIKDLYIR
jgi:hypothetical protein